jgi:hypothetical protein
LEDNSTGASYIGVNKSTATSPAVTFGNPVLISGQFSTAGAFEDKEFLAIDNTGGTFDGRVYVGWSEFPAIGNPQAMLAASSSTSPLSFSPSIEVAPSSSSFQHGVIPAVAPDGSVYVAWSTLTSFSVAASATINLVKSTNGGASFANPDPSDPNPTKTVASFTSTTGSIGTGSISIRTRSFPYLAIDNTPSGSPTRGNMYVVFQGQPTSSASPRSEIFFTSSTDEGKTWSAPRNISSGPAATLGADPTTNDNWMPSISVSPVTGHIKVLFYSRREDPANQKIRVYETGSTDAGMTWYNEAFSAVDFTPSTGYDPLINPTYMGDYLYAFADADGLIGAWGDTRNLCSPPPSAASPCSPSGRGDQDVWSKAEADKTGVDLAITPWGFVTGVGPTWQTPDIFVVNSSNVQVNAEKGIVNNLRARIRNLGDKNATQAVVRFRFAPFYAGIPDSAFKVIGTVKVNVPAGGTPQIVPIDWNLKNLNDTNGGIWPAPISAFDHFCLRVDIKYPSDINLSNNDAQNNFFDVTTATGPLGPIHFLFGNPLDRPANIQIVADRLPEDVRKLVKPPVIELPSLKSRFMTEAVTNGKAVLPPAIKLTSHELRVGTITLTRPPASVTQHLTHDLIVNVNSVADGKIIGGFSVLLARANVTIKPVSPGPIHTVSKQVGKPVPESKSNPQKFELNAPLSLASAHESIVAYLASRDIAIEMNDPQRGLVSSHAIALSHQQLLASIPEQARAMVPADASGRYYVSLKTTSGERQGAAEGSHIVISVRILVLTTQDLDSPLAGRLVPSNGTIEQTYLTGLNAKLNLR